ncbi:MAG: chloride channel protein [Rickettsiales bacterium]
MRSYLRKARLTLFSINLWRRRLVFWFGAITVGIISSYFALAVDETNKIFEQWIKPNPLLTLIISPLIFALCAWLTSFVPTVRGSGIPQVIAARVLRDPKNRERLLGIHIAFIKIFLTLLGLLAGASIGREGPTVQVGASIMLLCATIGGISAQRGVVLAGAAAGVAAAFNTPLAGIVFAIEEMARAFEHRNSSIVLIAIVLSGGAAMSIMGNYDYFGYTDIYIPLNSSWLPILIIGGVGGICGGIFARLITNGEGFLRNRFGKFGIKRPILFAAICGLTVAAIGIMSGGITYGTGYTLGHDLLHGKLEAEWWQMPAKLLATTLSTISGIPGGIFSPSLSVGASLGAGIADWFPSIQTQGVIVLAMVAYFAGVTQAPITAFVIVLEITGNATDAVPLIAAGVIATAISRMISPTSLYHSLAKSFMLDEKAAKTA